MRAIAPKSNKGDITFVFEKGNFPKESLQQLVLDYKIIKVRGEFESKIEEGSLSIRDAEKTHHIELMERLTKNMKILE